MLDAEPIKPGEGELTAAYRLVARLGVICGSELVGTIVGDALYDCEPFRTAVREAGFWSVVRHKNADGQPGGELVAEVDRCDPKREKPHGWHRDPVTGRRYDYRTRQEQAWSRPSLRSLP